MKQHVIIGHFGSSDHPTVQIATNEVSTSLSLLRPVGGLGHGMDQALKDLSQLGVFPSELGVDLMILAAHIHAADTRLSRQTESQDSWTREIRLVVPVSDVKRWERAIPVLKQMLSFLTGDRWMVTFRERPQKFAILAPPKPGKRKKQQFDLLALFSGGLDSLIATIDALERGSTPLLISHAGDPATSNAQDNLFQMLKQYYQAKPFDRFYVWLNLPSDLVKGVSPENTTRARSFLFISLGILAATGFSEGVTLNVPENGFIALNVPLDPLRLGSYSTRTTHPFYLARWKDLLNVIGVSVAINNPYWLKTKGEMIADCANPDLLRRMIAGSLSCSSPSKGRWKGYGIEHCGYCLPCLVRRAAIKRSFGRRTDPTNYSLQDLTAQVLSSQKAEGEHVRSIQVALAKLQAKPNLAKLLIHKPGPLSDVDSAKLNDLAEVYRRGLEEIGALLANVQARPR